MNRDELLTRPLAHAPRMECFGPRQAILPIDTASGGTWVAVNDAGIAFALLNRSRLGDRQPLPDCTKSRGLIIPLLLRCGSVEGALLEASRFNADEFAPFRLVVVDRESIGQVESDGRRQISSINPLGDEPLMVTSSGLGDELVEDRRRKLFKSFSFQSADAQDDFHRHRWPSMPHLSVCMNRDDARTVSYSVIEVRGDSARFSYHADAPDRLAKCYSATLRLVSAGVT